MRKISKQHRAFRGVSVSQENLLIKLAYTVDNHRCECNYEDDVKLPLHKSSSNIALSLNSYACACVHVFVRTHPSASFFRCLFFIKTEQESLLHMGEFHPCLISNNVLEKKNFFHQVISLPYFSHYTL